MRRPVPEDLSRLLGDDNNAPWDVDTVILQVRAGALPYFGILWELGGSSPRGASSDFPAGLELCDKHHSAGGRAEAFCSMNKT